MSDNNNDLAVYIYRGDEGERVPKTAEKLIVEEGVQELPFLFCKYYRRLWEVALPDGLINIGCESFLFCEGLLVINIPSTVQYIGKQAFRKCTRLAKVEIESTASSSHQLLATIDDDAFYDCISLQRIILPSSVTTVGRSAFYGCRVLVEANLSTTNVTHISVLAFARCSSLQTVSLPKAIEGIGRSAFYECSDLVTVVVPICSKPIRIENQSFYKCRRLANFVLPRFSAAANDSFSGCELLHERYSEDGRRIAARLIHRFDGFPVHAMCYHHSGVTPQELRQCIEKQDDKKDSFVDSFGMTVFHVLFSNAEPSIELLEVLLELYPLQILNWVDANGKRPLDYLMNNWSEVTVSLLRPTLQKWMIDPLVNWGTMLWMDEMKTKVRALLSEHDKAQRMTLINELYYDFGRYEKIESIAILELALWKCKLKSGWNNDGSKRQALDRVDCRWVCGSDVVISNVTGFFLG